MHTKLQHVSTKDLIRVRRLAARRRAAVACPRCKQAKIRCTDNRPCKKCAKSNLECFEKRSDSPQAPQSSHSKFSNDPHCGIEAYATVRYLIRENQTNALFGDPMESTGSTSSLQYDAGFKPASYVLKTLGQSWLLERERE